MEFKNGAEQRGTVVAGSLDEFKVVMGALKAEQFQAAIDARRDEIRSLQVDCLADIVKKFFTGTLMVPVRGVLLEATLDYNEMATTHMALANAADEVAKHQELYRATDGNKTHTLRASYHELAAQWEQPAVAAQQRMHQ
jgi:hypothetical protein